MSDGSTLNRTALPMAISETPPLAKDLPSDREAAMAGILAGDLRRVMLLGGRDAGKSTFCGLLLRHAA